MAKKNRVLAGKKVPHVLDFLISDLLDLSINVETISDKEKFITHLSQKYGFDPASTDAKTFLKAEIRRWIADGSIEDISFFQFEKYVAISYFAGNTALQDIVEFFHLIRQYINQVECYTDNPQYWLRVKDYLQDLIALNYDEGNKIPDVRYPTYRLMGDAVKYLREKGFAIDIGVGLIGMAEADNDRLVSYITAQFTSLGFWGAKLALSEMRKAFDSISLRYYFNYLPDIMSPATMQTPWGYIYNASLAHFRPTPKTKRTEKKFCQVCELVAHYLCLYQLQDFNIIRFDNRHTVMNSLKKHIMYDNIFSVAQANPKDFFKLIDGICTRLPTSRSLVDIYIDIYESVLEFYIPSYSIQLDPQWLFKRWERKYTQDQLANALKKLSFLPADVNPGYAYPENTPALNSFSKPFIFNGIHYVCPDLNFSCTGFLFAICNELEYGGVDVSKIGTLAEEFLVDRMRDHGLKVHHGKEYDISADDRKVLGTTRDQGECDLIIETDTIILFLEVKKKTLTAEARSGNIIKATQDVSKSLLHGLAQSGWHELLLRTKGAISFRDGTNLRVGNRHIERATVSIFDFYSIDDSHFVHGLLANFVGSKITSLTHKLPGDLHEFLDQLSAQYAHPTFQEVYASSPNPFWNCSFFSILQLMVVLRHCSDNDTFIKELFSVRTFTLNSKDWYRDYYHKKSLLGYSSAN